MSCLNTVESHSSVIQFLPSHLRIKAVIPVLKDPLVYHHQQWEDKDDFTHIIKAKGFLVEP